MTRDEIETFIREKIRTVVGNESTVWQDAGVDVAVDEIANRWEEDVQENRDASYQEGIHVGQESV